MIPETDQGEFSVSFDDCQPLVSHVVNQRRGAIARLGDVGRFDVDDDGPGVGGGADRLSAVVGASGVLDRGPREHLSPVLRCAGRHALVSGEGPGITLGRVLAA